MPEIIVIAHNIRSIHNVGSIFRTCEGFGVKKLIISGYTPYPSVEDDIRLPHIRDKITHQIHKTALGAERMIPFEYYENFEDWRETMPKLSVFALEQSDTSVSLRDITVPQKFALLLGEEVKGVASELLQHVETIIEIPMYGSKESFNVSVAAGIALYQLTA